MPTESAQQAFPYFETPERTERLQLVIHLLNNAEDVPYLRAPSGAGKTRFAAHLVDKLEDDYVVVWLNAGVAQDIQMALLLELGLEPQDHNGPDDMVAAAGERLLLVVVDDADGLDLAAIGQLFELHDAGARLLFLGNGGLSQLQGDWDLQFVDLPPFSEAQSLAFLETSGRVHEGALSPQMASGLHRAAGGLPGHLIDALSALPEKKPADPVPAQQDGGLSLWMLILGGLAVLALVLIVVFQDSVNALFEPPETVAPAPMTEPPAAVQAIEREQSVVPPKPVPKPELPVVQAPPVPAQPELPVEMPPLAEPEGPAEIIAEASEPSAEPAAEVPPAELQEPDPVLDAVIDAAIAAAEQAPAEEVRVPPVEQPPLAGEASAPAPAEPRVSAPPEPEVAEQSEPEKVVSPIQEPVAKPVPVTAPKASPGDDEAWLKARAPARYTLQLVGARDRASIARFIEKHRVAGPYAIYTRQLNGSPWYSLVAGDYPDRDAAVQARAELPPPLNRSGVWPRTFASIHEQLGQ